MRWFLLLRTDKPEAELYVYNEAGVCLGEHIWMAHRTLARDILSNIDDLRTQHQLEWSDMAGVGVWRGPGSFTGLRIGITVANSLSYAQHIPVVGVTGDDWREAAVHQLQHHQGDVEAIVLPEYGATPHITRPKK